MSRDEFIDWLIDYRSKMGYERGLRIDSRASEYYESRAIESSPLSNMRPDVLVLTTADREFLKAVGVSANV